MIRSVATLMCLAVVGTLLIQAATAAAAADVEEARQQFLSGNYDKCIALAGKAIKNGEDDEDWHILLSQALLTTGQYPRALAAITNALAQQRQSIRLRWQARDVFLHNGQPDAAAQLLEEIVQRFSSYQGSYRDAASLVVLGKAALLGGADPKRVLDKILETARKADPKLRDVYLASGELALEKHDFALAAKKFQEGLKQLPEDPDLYFGLAQAFAPSDQSRMIDALEAALERNSNHIGSLLLLADHNIDAEDYGEAGKLLDRIKTINPWQPEAWAYRAVIAHLQNQPDTEKNARATALKFWPTDPRVDHLIGKKLSEKYRFAEGSAHQRQALEFDTNYLPAKAQLAQDLLRLGEEADGWKLAEEVQKRDAYDVAAFNLTTLHDTMGKFATLTNQNFIVRMGSHEAAVYGQRVLALLEQARSNLSAKYGFEPKRPTTVEVFPEQKDFAVRTFGMPGNPGYLGVCFGTVVTANSPAAHPGHPVNWQAVLWHEFCHVVTLQMTRNKMPRWLSEGISVYEERQANPSWGEHLTPRYREMILGEDLTPVSKLSAAFLTAPSEHHLQFAYYESSLVVEFLVQQFGLDKLKSILHDLGDGAEINQTLEKNTVAMAEIEKEFAAFARERADKLAPGLDWAKPDLKDAPVEIGAVVPVPPLHDGQKTNASVDSKDQFKIDPRFRSPSRHGEVELTKWIASHPTTFYALSEQARRLIEEKKFQQAKAPLEKLIQLYPAQIGADSAYRMLAIVHRELGETNAERLVLARLAEQDNEAIDAYLRLMELGTAVQDWPAVTENAERFLAVDPLVSPPYRFLAKASEQTDAPQSTISAYRALLQLDPPDPAELHFHLAQALHRVHDPEARRHVLQALEESPRYRDALKLLLRINGASLQSEASVPLSESKVQLKP
ncbi:MAG: tetratricopeptide repeat protein [Verrucomicrobia bacterium]|nr:tetratricopeptide repeat protein [Verrucomicrobiota bacterium]